jgi:hypothetical protein
VLSAFSLQLSHHEQHPARSIPARVCRHMLDCAALSPSAALHILHITSATRLLPLHNPRSLGRIFGCVSDAERSTHGAAGWLVRCRQVKDRLKYREIAAADLHHERALLKSEMERVQKVGAARRLPFPRFSHDAPAPRFRTNGTKAGMDATTSTLHPPANCYCTRSSTSSACSPRVTVGAEWRRRRCACWQVEEDYTHREHMKRVQNQMDIVAQIRQKENVRSKEKLEKVRACAPVGRVGGIQWVCSMVSAPPTSRPMCVCVCVCPCTRRAFESFQPSRLLSDAEKSVGWCLERWAPGTCHCGSQGGREDLHEHGECASAGARTLVRPPRRAMVRLS